MSKMKAVASGTLNFGGREVDCYVLEDGRRVISQRGIQAGIGAAKDGKIDRLISRLPSRFADLNARPTIEFITSTNAGSAAVAIGRDRMFFVQLCDAYADAWAAGELHPKQEPIAKVAMAIIRALAKVGIDALIDEATGYQRVRENDYLRRLLDHSLREEAGKWELQFPESVPRALAPLWGVAYVSGPHPKELHRAYGQIYDMVLGKDVADEMRARNRETKASTNHHQWLQDSARGLLSDDIRLITFIASQCGSKAEFWRRMRHHYCREPLQLGLGA